MAVYLGSHGGIELKRDSFNVPLISDLDPDDVNAEKRRFSFDFDPGSLISGDQVDIETVDGSELTFINAHAGDGWRGYIHVDPVGGIRLYEEFSDAVSGNKINALELTKPAQTIPIQVSTRGSLYRCLAQIQSYQLTDSRETVDITSLGEEFRRNYANGLISGQGSMQCIWDYESTLCDPMTGEDVEFPHYLAQLVIRLKQGADFMGRFLLHKDAQNRGVWQEATCIVSNVGISVEATQIITTSIEFVTTGEIRLYAGVVPSHILLESTDKLLKQDAGFIDAENGD